MENATDNPLGAVIQPLAYKGLNIYCWNSLSDCKTFVVLPWIIPQSKRNPKLHVYLMIKPEFISICTDVRCCYSVSPHVGVYTGQGEVCCKLWLESTWPNIIETTQHKSSDCWNTGQIRHSKLSVGLQPCSLCHLICKCGSYRVHNSLSDIFFHVLLS